MVDDRFSGCVVRGVAAGGNTLTLFDGVAVLPGADVVDGVATGIGGGVVRLAVLDDVVVLERCGVVRVIGVAVSIAVSIGVSVVSVVGVVGVRLCRLGRTAGRLG